MREFGNCKMQRKIDGKIIIANRVGEDKFCPDKMCMLPTAKYYSEDGIELVRSSWREIEHKDDHKDYPIVVIDWGMSDAMFGACVVILLAGIAAFFGLR